MKKEQKNRKRKTLKVNIYQEKIVIRLIWLISPQFELVNPII